MEFKRLFSFVVVACFAALFMVSSASAIEYADIDLSPLIGMRPLDGIPMGDMFANERMNIYIDNEPVASLVMSDGTIEEAGFTVLEDPSMNIYATAETVTDIAMGKMSLGDAFLSGDIRYEGVGFVNSFKTSLAGFGAWLYSLFS